VRKPTVVQFEITGNNGAVLHDFYAGLFGWETRDTGTANYGRILSREAGLSGAIGESWDGGPGQLTIFVEVDDLEVALARAEELGGRVISAPPRAEHSKAEATGRYYQVASANIRFAFVADPAGHVIGLSQGLQRGLEAFER
jgi:predicted enzyme related to lactoylglutathione lyase